MQLREKENLELCSGWYGASLLNNTPKEEFELMKNQPVVQNDVLTKLESIQN